MNNYITGVCFATLNKLYTPSGILYAYNKNSTETKNANLLVTFLIFRALRVCDLKGH